MGETRMFLSALSFLSGTVGLSLFATLPGSLVYVALLLSAGVAWVFRKRSYAFALLVPTLVLSGLGWAQWHALDYLTHVLPESLAGQDVVVTGRIDGIPLTDTDKQRFFFDIDSFAASGRVQSIPRRIRLSWYYGQAVRAGETWQFEVRLKPPHGFMNPGGFDYEAWLMQHGVHATGYVRTSELNRKLKSANRYHSGAVRQRLAERIAAFLAGERSIGLITALAIGDRSAIDAQQWRVLINTGTNHLVAISGLHIGLAAAFGYWLCRRLLPSWLMLRIPAQHVAMVVSLVSAFVYALLAGFAIPTQRALLMLVCSVAALLLRRNARSLDVLGFALIAVLLWDPAAVLSAGFWFSFLAVAVIFFALSGRIARSRWMKWVGIQVAIALALLPLSWYMFQQASLVAPLANLFMVPYVSLLVVPLVLLGILTLPLSTAVAAALLSTAEFLLSLIWPLLQWLADLRYAHWLKAQPDIALTLLALMGVAILLAPKLRLSRAAGVLLLLPAAIWEPSPPPDGAFELNVLDVGQGLAIVIRTHSHTLVYDTGARFSDSFDSGSAVLLPFLINKGVDQIDLLLVSHGDGDHIGGAAAVLAAYPKTPVLGRGIGDLIAVSKTACTTGQHWNWDHVEFTLLHPDDTDYPSSNNQSCVLKITGRGGSVLIPGDIEKKVENQLLSGDRATLLADILIAPHHGSTTSSSTAFITAVSPQITVFAAGYRNRYQFPAASIVERYHRAGSQMFMTGHSGAISIELHPEHGIGPVQRYRDMHRKYWHHSAPNFRQDG